MTLDQYLKQGGPGALPTLAKEMSVSKSRLSQLRNDTNWPPALALEIERVTGGAVGASEVSHIIAMARAA